MSREVQCGVQHARCAHVVHVPPIAERELRSLVLGTRSTDGRREHRRHLPTSCDGLDRVEHLDVAGTATEMRTEVASHVGTLEIRALLVDLCLRPHHDARDAESALEPSTRGESVGKPRPLCCIDTFECEDLLPGHLGHRLLAAHDRLAVDVHRAAPALTARRTSILGRREIEFVSQRGQQMRMIRPDRHGDTVDGELDRVGKWCHVGHV